LKESETVTNAIDDLEKQRFELRDIIRQKKSFGASENREGRCSSLEADAERIW
jgi:hypothetical protein